MAWLHAGCEGLRDLAHALGPILLGREHITLGHVEFNIAPGLLHQFGNQLVSLLAESLTYGVEEDADEVAVFGQPLVDAFDVELVTETSVG